MHRWDRMDGRRVGVRVRWRFVTGDYRQYSVLIGGGKYGWMYTEYGVR